MKTLLYSVIFLLLNAVSINAETQSTAIVTGTDKGVNVTLPAPFNSTVFAGTFKATINSQPKNLYCIDLGHFLAYNEPYQDVTSTDSLMTYVLNNYYPFKTYPYTGSASTVDKEAAAVQLALWKIADGLNIGGCTNVDASVITRANAIYADAIANAHVFSLNSFFIDIPAQNFSLGNPISFTVKAFDNMGIAMANVTIVLTTSQGTLSSTNVTTNATGVTPVITLTPGIGQTTATITASGTVGIPAGTKYYHVANPNGKQKLILATPTIAARTISRDITWYNQIQLAVSKKADRTAANDGDIINYTLVAKNIGTESAQSVVVTDILPSILDYISTTPAGVYNSSTGIWSVGNLNAGDSATLVIKTKVNYAHSASTPFHFGAAQDFNMFVIDTLIQPSADTQGKLAVGGYADLSGYSVGDQLPANSGNVLVCGNHLTYLVGRVYNGKAVYQDYITSTMGFSADDGIVKDSVINFPAAKLHLNNLSSQLASLSRTDTNVYSYSNIILNGSKTGLNVFYLDGSKLLTANNVTINAPAGSTVLINISGDSTRLFGGFEVNGTSKTKVLLNFYQATKLHFSGIDVRASVLAPQAVLNFPAGIVTGQLMVRCMYGSGQINLSPFDGSLTNDTTITNIATIDHATVGNMPSFFTRSFSKAQVASGLTGLNTNTKSGKPASFKLEQNYPNPFNPSTVIRFAVPQDGFVTLNVYNVTGELVNSLINRDMNAGVHEVSFNASELPSGIYICRMTSGSFSAVQKMVLTK